MKLAAAIAPVVFVGCEFLSTRETTGTRDMRLWVVVGSSDAGTHVSMALTGPFGDPELGPSDSFEATLAGAPLALAGDPAAWTADTPARGGALVFTLRHEGDYDATASTSVPPPSGLAGKTESGALVLDWTPQAVAGTTTITIAGDCAATQTLAIATDTGHYVVQGAQLQAVPSACTLTGTLERDLVVDDSPWDSPFLNATITQKESVQIAWNP